MLEKGAPQRALPDEFYSFVKVKQASPQYAMTVDFGDAIRPSSGSRRSTSGKRKSASSNTSRHCSRPHSTMRSRSICSTRMATWLGGSDRPQPALVWYPTSRWQQGETIEVVANTLPWWTGDKDAYAIALGISANEDPWDVGARLPVHTLESEWVTPLIDDRTLLQLMTFRRIWELHYPEATRRQLTPPKIAHATDVSFAGRTELVGFTLPETRVRPGGTLEVVLYWKATTRWKSSYKVFVQLLSTDGQVVAQQDTIPGEGRFPTDNWMPGEYVTDAHHLGVGENVPPGYYDVIAGLYDPDTMARLQVIGDPSIAQGDHVVLDQEIEIYSR